MSNIITTECPYYLLTRASLAATAMLRRGLADANVDYVRPAYLGVLVSLWQEDRLKAGELGRRAGLEPSTMTGLLDRMERDALLSREADPEDRRAQRIVLTPLGREAQAPVTRVLNQALEGMLDGVSPSHLQSLKRVLRQVLANTTR